MRSNEDPVERFLTGLDFVQKSCVVLYLFVTTSIGEINIKSNITRKHSSRMRTVRMLPVGDTVLGDVVFSRGCHP